LIEAELVQDRPEHESLADCVGHSFQAGAAVPAPAHMPARQLHRQRVARALELRRIADADQDLRREFLQIARHREQHRRRRLEYRRRNVLGIVAEMRNELRDHRQRNPTSRPRTWQSGR
jgi:hypothetical protein